MLGAFPFLKRELKFNLCLDKSGAMIAGSIVLDPVKGLPEVRPGDSLSQLLAENLKQMGPCNGDILVVAQKVVSKAEGRVCKIADVSVSEEANRLARQTGKIPELVELILQESHHVVKSWEGTIIVQDKRGLVMANAGIDQSNANGDDEAILLPEDPDASATNLRRDLRRQLEVDLGVIISDSFGRPWRRGVVGFAIGASGVEMLHDASGRKDRRGRELMSTEVGVGDALTAAAVLAMGEADEGHAAVLIRGWASQEDQQGASVLQRPPASDQFL